MRQKANVLAALVATAAALALTGCASTYTLQSQVSSYSQLGAIQLPRTYRFERLPSRAADPGQARLEAIVAAELGRVGLVPGGDEATLAVGVDARVALELSPFADPRWGWGPGPGWGWGSVGVGGWGRHGGVGLGWGGPIGRYEPPWRRREISIVMRDAVSGKVLYETGAASDEPYGDDDRALAAMAAAALSGFPNPPAGPRRVDSLIGR